MARVDRMPTTTSIGQALPSVLIDGCQTLQRLPTRASVEHEVIGTDAKSCLAPQPVRYVRSALLTGAHPFQEDADAVIAKPRRLACASRTASREAYPIVERVPENTMHARRLDSPRPCA